jgi:hypothetical protein
MILIQLVSMQVDNYFSAFLLINLIIKVSRDKSGKLVSIGSLFYDRKFSRSGAYGIHLGDVYFHADVSQADKMQIEYMYLYYPLT